MEREEVEGRVATAKVHWGGGHTLKKCSYLTAIYCVLPQCLLTFGDRLCDTLQGWASLSMKDYTHPYEWRATLFEDLNHGDSHTWINFALDKRESDRSVCSDCHCR